MNRSEKTAEIANLKNTLESNSFIYLTDASTLTVAAVSELRGLCHEKGIQMKVVKNTLVKKAIESMGDDHKGFDGLVEYLKGPTAIMLTETANLPAKVLKDFRKTHVMPTLKVAYIDSSLYVGDDQIKVLAALKSKEELVGEIISLLQSPAKNVISALKSGGSTIAGILKTLQEREEAPAS